MSHDVPPRRTTSHDDPPRRTFGLIPEFGVYQDGDGRWHGDHVSGRHIDADTFDRLECRAVVVRVVTGWWWR